MKISALLLCCVALLALPCASLGTASAAETQLGRVGKLSAFDARVAPALRGKQAASGQPRQREPIVALQLSQVKKVDGKKKVRRAATKHSHSELQRLSKMHGQHTTHKHKQVQTLGGCRKNKLKWWIKIKRKCRKAFGKESRWDRDRNNGQCKDAWNECSTGFYAVCCTQPTGAKNMEAYCAGKNVTFYEAADAHKEENQDKACHVQRSMKKVQDAMKGIKQTVSLMGIEQKPTAYQFAPMPMPAPMPAPAIPTPPPGLMAPAPAPAPAPVVLGPSLPTPLESKCAMLTELTRQAAERIKAIKAWAKQDGIPDPDNDPKKHAQHSAPQEVEQELEKANPQSAEAKDPDLVFSVKGVISVGSKLDALLKENNFCGKGPEEDDDDEDDVEEDLAQDPTKAEEEDEEEDDEFVLAVNETSILELLDWETNMDDAVEVFEKDVHPHGYKWWRYRFEYTIVESIVLAFSVICKYCTMWLLHGVSFFDVHKFYKTGITMRLHRYAWGYLVFHAASLMIMVTFAYMLYIPWGQNNIFDVFARAFHDFIDGRANVPFIGYSWLYMVLDVQFQLFVCFALYSLFVVMVASNYKKALEDWKSISDEREDPSVKPANAREYNTLDALIKKRVQNTPEYRQIFHELKLNLPGVEGLDKALPGWNEFKLHLYLTDGLGKSLEYLVQVSLTTNMFLAVSALVVAVLAHYYEVAFMYFLPGFLVIGAVMFVTGYFVSNHFRKLSANDSYNSVSGYVTVHSYCRAIQVLLYCIFFSFSRLLLSSDIFEFYPVVYISALVSLVVVLAVLALVAGQVIKETSCALILPPHIPQEQFKRNLQQVLEWHTTEKCHECGVQQFPMHSTLSKEWAGKMPSGERKLTPDSARPYSWRG